jgi:hypothetical protein
MDRSLRLWEWLQLRLHLLVCAWCTRYLKQIRFIRQLLREEMPNQESQTRGIFDAEARQRITASLRKQ